MKLKQPAAVKLSFAGNNSNDFIEIIGDILSRYNLNSRGSATLTDQATINQSIEDCECLPLNRFYQVHEQVASRNLKLEHTFSLS